MDSQELLYKYLSGQATNQEIENLNDKLLQDPGLRTKLLLETCIETGLREISMEHTDLSDRPELPKSNFFTVQKFIGFAATILICFLLIPFISNENKIATIVSSENAAWESSLPTLLGSQLPPGVLHLKSGIATIKFHSGAEVLLESPSTLELLDPMKGRLLSGSLMVDVPESATGFIIETPESYVVDYGTQFSVRVDKENKKSDYELIEGEIVVHHPYSGKEVRLKEKGRIATIDNQTLKMTHANILEENIVKKAHILRVKSNKHARSFIANDKLKSLSSDLLSVKKSSQGKWDQKIVINFNIDHDNFNNLKSVNLRLNQVLPRKNNSKARLPIKSQFYVYGAKSAYTKWDDIPVWSDAPTTNNSELLATFEIPRSQNRGHHLITDIRLIKFIKNHQGKTISLMINSDSKPTPGVSPGPAHCFANDSHPESTGPTLEFTFYEEI